MARQRGIYDVCMYESQPEQLSVPRNHAYWSILHADVRVDLSGRM